MGRALETAEMIPLLAERFRALAEPARLQLIHTLLFGGELTVNELVDRTGLQQANVSKHLQLLHALGFLSRRKNGLFVYYSLADQQVPKLYDLMCERVVLR